MFFANRAGDGEENGPIYYSHTRDSFSPLASSRTYNPKLITMTSTIEEPTFVKAFLSLLDSNGSIQLAEDYISNDLSSKPLIVSIYHCTVTNKPHLKLTRS